MLTATYPKEAPESSEIKRQCLTTILSVFLCFDLKGYFGILEALYLHSQSQKNSWKPCLCLCIQYEGRWI